jgi:hypothetical protein
MSTENEGVKQNPLLAATAANARLKNRDHNLRPTDAAAVRAIAQAAVNVELFTIPLYMASMTSIKGMHQVTSKNSTAFQGIKWPGLSPSPEKSNLGNIQENTNAYNSIFSVFIEEMLHLQLAANLASCIGQTPSFTELLSKSNNYGWTCYGTDENPSTVIPYILDFKDCKPEKGTDSNTNYSDIKVKLGPLNAEQLSLFLAIEEDEETARERIADTGKYFPTAPFKNWNIGDKLPMFGTIGAMYQCLYEYLNITYDQGPSLWDSIYVNGALQIDIFNATASPHTAKEYPFNVILPNNATLNDVLVLISAITDQGEGSTISHPVRTQAGIVEHQYRADYKALQTDYPSYTDTGTPAPSTHAYSRSANDGYDHYERFVKMADDLKSGKIVTWDQWVPDNKWTPDDFKAAGYSEKTQPRAEDLANALNSLANPKGGETERKKNKELLCQIATGALYGVTSAMDQCWDRNSGNSGYGNFPMNAMRLTGDRMMIVWAIFGEMPDISIGVAPLKDGVLYHACQGLSLDPNTTDDANFCASPQIYHSCQNSNACRTEGGCGWVNPIAGTSNPITYSAPADNACKNLGGCAVPISNFQVFTASSPKYPVSGSMELYDPKSSTPDKSIGQINYAAGDKVYNIAWDAYSKVVVSRGKPTPVKPTTISPMRLVFPPS